MPCRPRPARRLLRATLAALVGALVLVQVGTAAPASAANPVTPGNLTAYGFDQCQAPSQATMDTWMKYSPFLAAGIYISGKSRACRVQPNITPEWIAHNLAMGWRLLPITLGPQASCQPRFPRYSDDVKINPAPGSDGAYGTALAQGVAEGASSVADASALGIVPGSTLWYDLEGFDLGQTQCRESALRFVSGWVQQVKAAGYVAGFYSSASSGIKMLDDARRLRPGQFTLPDQLWIARWDGYANTSTSFIGDDGWRPGGRMKQYQGGHNETWGGVTINIDRNYLDLGTGSVAPPETHCGGVPVDFARYRVLRPTSDPALLAALNCLLTEQGVSGRVTMKALRKRTLPPAAVAWLAAKGLPAGRTWNRQNWVALLSAGSRPILKVGSYGEGVRRVQRALNAAGKPQLAVSGTFDAATDAAFRAYQAKVGLRTTGVVAGKAWKKLQAGRIRR